jgi:hypothetical protein
VTGDDLTAPVNVRAVLADDSEVPLEGVRDADSRDGMHVWRYRLPAGAAAIRCDVLPGRTGLRFAVPNGEEPR